MSSNATSQKQVIDSHSYPSAQTFIKKHALIIAVIYNILLLGLFAYIGQPYYETNDDHAMYLISSGVLGVSSPYLPFSQLWLGFVLQKCFSFIPTVNWLSLYQYFIMLVAFTTISDLLFSSNKRFHSPLGFILPLVLAPFFYTTLQFTRSAALCAIAGSLLLYFALFERKKASILLSLIGMLLVFLGISLRTDVFILSFVPFAFFILLKLFLNPLNKQNWRKTLKASQKPLLIFSLCSVFLLSSLVINGFITNYFYKDYNTYNAARSDVLDFPPLVFDEHKEELQALSLNENDLRMLYTWHFDDPVVFSTDVMVKLAELAKTQKQETSLKTASLVQNIDAYLSSTLFLFAFISFIIALLLNQKENRLCILILMVALLTISAAFFVIIQRFPYRVQDSLSLCFLIMFLFSFPQKEVLPNTSSVFTIGEKMQHGLLWVIITTLLFGITSLEEVYTTLFDPQTHATVYEYFPDHPEKTYINDTITTQSYLVPQSVFITQSKGTLQNAVSTGNWLTNHPVALAQKQVLGIEAKSVFEILYQDHVRYVTAKDTNARMVLQYLKDHVNPKTSMKETDEVTHHVVWQFYVQE